MKHTPAKMPRPTRRRFLQAAASGAAMAALGGTCTPAASRPAGEAARPALAAIKKTRMKGGGHVGGYVGRMVAYVPKTLE